MILRELLTQRQSRMVLLAYGGGEGGGGVERRGKTGRGWGILLPLLFPLSFLFAPATEPKCFFLFYESCRQDGLHRTLDLCSCRFNQTKLVVT